MIGTGLNATPTANGNRSPMAWPIGVHSVAPVGRGPRWSASAGTGPATMSSMPHPSQADVSDLSDLIDSTSVTLTDVVLALVVFIGAWVLARMARRGVFHVLGRLGGVSEDMRQLASRVTFYFILIIGIGVSMTFLGAGIQPVLTAAILVGNLSLCESSL